MECWTCKGKQHAELYESLAAMRQVAVESWGICLCENWDERASSSKRRRVGGEGRREGSQRERAGSSQAWGGSEGQGSSSQAPCTPQASDAPELEANTRQVQGNPLALSTGVADANPDPVGGGGCAAVALFHLEMGASPSEISFGLDNMIAVVERNPAFGVTQGGMPGDWWSMKVRCTCFDNSLSFL